MDIGRDFIHYNVCHPTGLWVEFEYLAQSVSQSETLGEKVGEKVGKYLTSNQEQILALLRQNPRMAAREVAQHIGISSRKVEQNIAKLRELELLKRIGSAKGGHWEIIGDDHE